MPKQADSIKPVFRLRAVVRAFAVGAVAAVLLLGVFALVWGYVAGWHAATKRDELKLERTIAISWGDGKYGKAFYGAQVYLVPRGKGFSVQGRVMIGDNANYQHDCGELGTANDKADAVAKWGHVEWRPDGLYIGTGENKHFTPQAEIESHR